jgi:hypothetical protein
MASNKPPFDGLDSSRPSLTNDAENPDDLPAGLVGAVRERMDRRGFDPADRLYRKTAKAYDSPYELRMGLHYFGCGMQAGNRTAGGMGYIGADGNPWAARVV